MNATFDQLIEVNGVGEVLARSIIDSFGSEDNLRLVERLRNYGCQMQVADNSAELVSEKLSGLKFVVIGNFGTSQRRKEIEAMVEANCGKLIDSVSPATNYIVAGENMGPAKLQKA